MSKINLFKSLLLTPVALVAMFGCKKTNNINNDQVVQTPYSLYFSDTAGTLYNSTDGKTSKVVFAADGVAIRCIFAMNNNILMAKSSLYVSGNNGVNFNNSYKAIDLATNPMTNIRGRYIDMNQSMGIFVHSWNHGYVASREPVANSYFGIAWNEQDGMNGWYPEEYYDSIQVSHIGSMQVTSFTLLQNETLVALGGATKKGLYRTSLPVRWKEMVSASSTDTLALPGVPCFYSLGHINNRIIAIDNYGGAGASYSDDLGTTWSQYAGVPANTPLTCISSPFEQICLVGTDSMGLYVVNNNTNSFEQVSSGLGTNLVVRSIAFKENVFKSGKKQQYVYIATNQGIYQSSDLGHNWTKTIPGNFVAVY